MTKPWNTSEAERLVFHVRVDICRELKLTCGNSMCECSILFEVFLAYKVLGTSSLTRNLLLEQYDIGFV